MIYWFEIRFVRIFYYQKHVCAQKVNLQIYILLIRTQTRCCKKKLKKEVEKEVEKEVLYERVNIRIQ